MSRRHLMVLGLILLGGLYFRGAGLFRGIERGVIFHPDAPKQVMMLHHYLHDRYVLYYDSLFYDGYPYGLNRLDEGIIRGVAPLRGAVETWLFPDRSGGAPPSRAALYYYGRLLRVAYGMAACLLIFAAVRMGSGRVGAALAATALYAFSPLGATVTHSVTGDVGVDLFLAASILCVIGYARKGALPWLFAFAVCCGMAFASKYQGLLGGWLGGVLLLDRMMSQPRRALRAAVVWTGIMAAGFVLGAVLLNPALLAAPSTTWRNMRLNFTFIQNYGVSPDFLARPFIDRMLHGLGNNLPIVLWSLGIGLALMSLAAMGWTVRQWFRERRPDAGSGEEPDIPDRFMVRRRAAANVGIATFPWLALVLATALKPAVQPFHFSFLLPAMAVSVGLLLAGVASFNARRLRLILGAVLAVALVELVIHSRREDYFWSRPETSGMARRFAERIFSQGAHQPREYRPDRAIKHFFLEPSRLPVFRNRFSSLEHPRLEWRNMFRQLPVPSIPYPEAEYWIFLNGLVFPRNDRMIEVPAGRGRHGIQDRALVFESRPDVLNIGLRTGRWPSRYTVRVGGRSQAGFLLPHEETVLAFHDPGLRRVLQGGGRIPDAFHVPVRMQAELGPVWATFMEGDADLGAFRRFGPRPESVAAFSAPHVDPDDVTVYLRDLRYLELDAPVELTRDQRVRVPGADAPLSAGDYKMWARLVNRGARPALVTFELIDPSGYKHGIAPHHVEIPSGVVTETEWPFRKAFAPYDAVLMVVANEAGVLLDAWSLRPDPSAAASGEGTDAPVPPETEFGTLASLPLNIEYPGLGTIREFTVRPARGEHEPLEYAVRFDLDEGFPHALFHEAVLFIHLLDDTGNLVVALDYSLRKARFADASKNWRRIEAIPVGRYRVVGGLYNVRTRRRYSFRRSDAPRADRRGRVAVFMDALVIAETPRSVSE